jgi:hypothetical protein
MSMSNAEFRITDYKIFCTDSKDLLLDCMFQVIRISPVPHITSWLTQGVFHFTNMECIIIYTYLHIINVCADSVSWI